uniref:ZIP family metal transporter n=1 Tax=candidate division WOR-3 bacterium TaxID=2052148 RepID=A0A7C4U6C4_UNCW3
MLWILALGSSIIVSLISFIGVLFIFTKNLNKLLLILVSFAAGALIGDAFIHLIPEGFEEIQNSRIFSLLLVLGIIIFFSLEKFLSWRHCHIPTSKEHPHPLAMMNIIGDGIHNFMDGIIIGASYSVNFHIGITTTLAVILHEIPQEIGDFGVLLFAGMKKRNALFFNFISALFAVFGTIITLIIGPFIHNFSIYLIPVTAGGFIYIACSDLIPKLQGCELVKTSLLQLIFLLLGILLMFLLLLIG